MSVIVTVQPTAATFAKVDPNSDPPSLVIHDSSSTVRITARPGITGADEVAEFARQLARTVDRWTAACQHRAAGDMEPLGSERFTTGRRHRGQGSAGV